MLKPIMANMLGQFGKSLEFYAFPAKDKADKPLADPFANGKIKVAMSGRSFSWRLPLGSLMRPKKCATCGEEFSGNYNVCPFDGTKLKEFEPVLENQ